MSKKPSLVRLLDTVKRDVRSVTGANLWYIMLEARELNIDNLKKGVTDIPYYPVPYSVAWRIPAVTDL